MKVEEIFENKQNKPLSSGAVMMIDVLPELMNPIPQLKILWKSDILYYAVYFSMF
jgi:hypothetical protein